MATFTGGDEANIRRLFGDNTIPTAFTSRKPASDVLTEIRKLNPDCTVTIS